MGGKSSQTQNSSQTTNPWQPTIGPLENIINQINPMTTLNPATNPAAGSAFGTLLNNAQSGNPYAPAIQGYASNLLSGGGANAQAPNVQGAINSYGQQLAPFLDPNFLDPSANPQMRGLLDTIRGDVSNQVNSQFAGAGRDLSGMNTQTLARGIAQGEAAPLLNAYQQNVQTQRGAQDSLYGARNQTAGLLTGLNQQGLANQGQGVDTSQAALQARDSSPQQVLSILSQQAGYPLSFLNNLTSLLGPIAGLGGQATGQQSGTSTMSGAQQFGMIGTGLGNMGKFLWSDERLKENIAPVGKLYDGQTIYGFNYKADITPRVGLLAQEVEKTKPEAVRKFGEFKAVDYEKATEDARAIGGLLAKLGKK